MFRLLTLLVSFGYYDDEKDIKDLFPKIVSCLDCKKDLLTKSKPKLEKSMSSVHAMHMQLLCSANLH